MNARLSLIGLAAVLAACIPLLNGQTAATSDPKPSADAASTQPATQSTQPAPAGGDWTFDAKEAARRQDEAAGAAGVGKELVLDLGNKVTMKLALIPAGKFMMGSPESEEYRSKSEGPLHEVTLTKSFYMAATEVTQAQYQAVTGKNPATVKKPQNPVGMVSWGEAAAFCKKLSEKTGKTVRLPTEAEWEYACRAGSKAKFSFGDKYSDIGDYAWYKVNSGDDVHPVGKKKPNAFGLYDMHGNVWEWCSDYFAKSYADAKNQDPQGPDSGTERAVRSGSVEDNPLNCRSAYRVGGRPGGRANPVGFRVVAEVK